MNAKTRCTNERIRRIDAALMEANSEFVQLSQDPVFDDATAVEWLDLQEVWNHWARALTRHAHRVLLSEEKMSNGEAMGSHCEAAATDEAA